jgi:hypothetical protein
MAEWRSKKYPDGCRHCGTLQRVHLGRGLCSKCYQIEGIRDLYDPAVERQDDGMEAYEAELEGGLSELQADPDALAVDRGAVGENPAEPLAGGPSEATTPGERAPGSGSSSPGPGAPPGKKKGLRGLFGSKKATQEAPPQTATQKKPKVPRGIGKRVSAADTIGDAWAGLGGLAIRSGRHVPLGRYMQFSSAVTGELLDDAAKGTFVDRIVLQPVAKGRGRFDALAAVFGPPAVILAMERDPSRAEVLIPVLKAQIRSALPMMVPAIKKVQEKERKAAEAAAELFPDLPEGVDPADAIIAMLFDGWTPPAPSAPEPDVATMNESDLEHEREVA